MAASLTPASDGSYDIAERTTHMFIYSSLVGVLSGLFTTLFIFLIEWGTHTLWGEAQEGSIHTPYLGIAVAIACALGVGLLRKHKGPREVPLEQEFGATGTVDYRTFPRMLGISLLSLWSGGSIGPEGSLSHLMGQISAYVAGSFGITKGRLQVFIFSGVAAVFGAYLGSPLVGTFLTLEMFHYKKYDYDAWILPALLASAISYCVYWLLGGSSIVVFNLNYHDLAVADALWALPLGVVGAALGIAFGFTFKFLGHLTAPYLSTRPIMIALSAGISIALTSLLLPIVLFSGHSGITQLLDAGSSLSVLLIALILLAKIVLTSICFQTGFKGGPIFPLLFIGTTGGILINALIPIAPYPIAIIAVTTGVLVLGMRLPFSAIILMTLTSSIAWSPIIIFAAVASYATLVLFSPFEKRPELIKLIPA